MTREHRWTFGHDDFPIRDAVHLDVLADTPGARMPRSLVAEGERADALAGIRVAIVGTRSATPMGLDDARDLGRFCAHAGITVVSGLALGIDAAAHEGALEAGGLTIGVVATGLDVVYPRRHTRLFARVREQGLVLGEHPPGTPPLPYLFPVRNRIIAALADAVIVVEAKATGGALSTAKYARLYNRTLYAMPGSRRNPAAAGCNRLIADGAETLLEPSDMLVLLGRGDTLERGWSPAPPQPLDADQRAVLRALGGDGASIDVIERRAGIAVERVGPAVRALEGSGHVVRKRGLWWPR